MSRVDCREERVFCAGDINWEGFTFQHGFRILRPRYEPVPLSPLPGTDSAAAMAGMKSEAGSTPVKVQAYLHTPSDISALLDHASSPWLAQFQGDAFSSQLRFL